MPQCRSSITHSTQALPNHRFGDSDVESSEFHGYLHEDRGESRWERVALVPSFLDMILGGILHSQDGWVHWGGW